MARITLKFKDREEWLAARKEGIGASEVATILGLNPFDTPYQMWLRKTGQIPPTEENFAMKRGHILEDAVAQFYADATGAQIIKSSAPDFMFVSKERPFLRVSPDRLFWPNGLRHNEKNKKILECKTTQRTIDPENVPLHWVCQVQMNLGVSGYDFGSLAWLDSHMDFGYVDIPFDKEFFDYMSDEVEKFWKDCVLGGNEPYSMTAEDVLMKAPVQTDGKTLSADDETMMRIEALRKLKADESLIKKEIDTLTDELKIRMEDCESIIGSDGKPVVTWKSSGKMAQRFDEAAFKAAHPDIYGEFVKEVPTGRRFIIKGLK